MALAHFDSRCSLAVIVSLTCALAGASLAGEPPRGWTEVLSGATPIDVQAHPVVIGSGELSGLALEGAWALQSTSPDFGGLSGILIDADTLYAVSDRGRWFSASLVLEDGSLTLEGAVIAPMRTIDGNFLNDATGDAEGLTRLGERLAVSFEGDNRIMVLGDSGALEDSVRSDVFAQFPSNEGLEALATLPDGRLIALAERTDGVEIPVILADPATGAVSESNLRRRKAHVATAADIGSDGRLYLLARQRPRFFWRFFGSSVRITRYDLGPDGFPVADSAEILATFDGNSGIDNLEGLAIEHRPGRRMHLWLIADDNFTRWERTLLLRFRVIN